MKYQSQISTILKYVKDNPRKCTGLKVYDNPCEVSSILVRKHITFKKRTFVLRKGYDLDETPVEEVVKQFRLGISRAYKKLRREENNETNTV